MEPEVETKNQPATQPTTPAQTQTLLMGKHHLIQKSETP